MRGIYVLLFSIGRNTSLVISSLGELRFEKGLYAYVGSAQNNIEKRVQRHLSSQKKKFWHIDFLLDDSNVCVMKVFHKEGRRPSECGVARELGRRGIPVSGFGCSDCRCTSHLFKIENYEFLKDFMVETEL